VAVPVPPAPPPEEQDTLPNSAQRLDPVGAGAAGPRGTRTLPRPAAAAPGVPAAHRTTVEPAPHLRARRRSRRLFAVWTAVVLALAVGVAVSAWWLGSGRWTAMPSLLGLEEAAAQQLLDQADLLGVSVRAFDDTAPEGRVTEADREVDAELLRGSTVTYTVSAGQPVVPAIAPGTDVSAAQQAVRDAGLDPVDGPEEFSGTVPQGAVIGTRPGAGARLPSGSPVELVVSRGEQPRQVRVPSVVGRSFAQAEAALADAGLDAEERPAFGPFGGTGGRVIGQSPGAGSMVERGTTIVLDTIPI
ncbi:MAG TPA: PASTA domain-containing protein, partial [Pseudonocardia sp.]|nr:PASTA domain-containing protein [Pseudonocardia sp.]